MTEIEHKVALVRKYILDRKGIDIKDIKLNDGLDLQKLNYAYKIAVKYYTTD